MAYKVAKLSDGSYLAPVLLAILATVYNVEKWYYKRISFFDMAVNLAPVYLAIIAQRLA